MGCSSEKETDTGSFINSYAQLKSLFADPPSEYRSVPLWDWNENITEEGIDFQMKEFKKAGIGGVFVHPRPGLLTEYLSDHWFHLFDYTVQKGKELDMKVWIYDENSYPSGFAGGHVPAEMPDSYEHGTSLEMKMQEKLDVQVSDTLAVVLKKIPQGFTNITESVHQDLGKEGTYYIFYKSYPGKSPWYGGFTYVDLLYKGVTEKFLDVTMTQGYEKLNKADFGETLAGVFTDEPNLEAAMPQGTKIRWTPDLFDAFEKRWGYDLKVHLPSLIEETGTWKKVRHDYYELLLELFVERWAKPWSKYCDENNLLWTGHYWEHGWPEPTHGMDEAAFYIWHQQPGVDMLGCVLDSAGLGGQFGNDRAVRELLSAANQAGRRRTLSETYGGGGWDMTFETQKRLADWQGVLGVNFVNQHLSYYSLNGVRKFDYPPSFSYHQPWWKHYKFMGDYLGRMSMAMSSGEQINETLVLQPNTSAWMYFSRKNTHPRIHEIKEGFKHFVYQMEQKHLEYDLGSESVLKEMGSVIDDRLRVGQREYNLLVIPAEMENIDHSTFELLNTYLKNGGKVLAFTKQIHHLDGAESSEVNELTKEFESQWHLAEDLNDPDATKWLKRDEFEMIDRTHNGRLYHQRRILDDGQILFVVNSHTREKASADITLKGKHVVELDLITGEIHAYPSITGKKKVSFQIDLEPVGSALFVVTDKRPEESELKDLKGIETLVESRGEIEVERESDNILMINYLDLKSEKLDVQDSYFMGAVNDLFHANGVDLGNPWQHKIQFKKNYLKLDSMFTKDSWFEVSYHFQVHSNLSHQAKSAMRAVVERPELWQVYVNGNLVEEMENGYWIEKSFPVFEIGDFVTSGNNTVTLKAPRMNILAEVMPIYIMGDFLVKPCDSGFEICQGKIEKMGAWSEAGLPFYSQTVAYKQTFGIDKNSNANYIIRLNEWKGTVAEVWVNGKSAGVIAWEPEELDVTPLLTHGENEVVVKVTGSLKNTFGFFYKKKEGWIFGPFTWNEAPEGIPLASDYFLDEYGLFEPFDLIQIHH